MWLLGVVLRRYIDFLILLMPTPLVSVLFCSSIPTFFSLKKMFFILVPLLFLNYILGIKFFFTQYKHIPATTGIPRHPYEGCTYWLNTKKHTQTYASYPAMDISCMSVV